MKTLLKNGWLVTASETFQADLLIEGEKIAQIGVELASDDAVVVDAAGKYVLPGAVDPHTHLDLPVMGTRSSDDFYTGHKAALFGGTTCHVDFAIQDKGETLHQALDAWQSKADGKAVMDYGFHINITDLNEAVLAELPEMPSRGVTSVKVMMAYKGRLQVDDTGLFRTLMKAAEAGLLVLVHAENGDVIDVLTRQAAARGQLSAEHHARTRPHWSEAEATLRAAALAAAAGAPLYVVHMSCASALDQLRYVRARGLPIMGETCPQYLFFSEADLCRPDGAKWICSPPVRTPQDAEALWGGLRHGELQVIATDHCPFFFDGSQPMDYEGRPVAIPGKELGGGDFTRTPNGLPGIEDRMPVLWSHGAGQGRLTLNQLVALCCTNPARIFGLYPRKGTLACGADADVVVWDPGAVRTMGRAVSHQRTDYNLYEGWAARGWPERVYRRGELVVEGSRWLGAPGSGRWLPRGHGACL